MTDPDLTGLFQCTWQVGTVGLKKKTGDTERIASDSVSQLCDSLIHRLNERDGLKSGENDWCERIRNSPRIAGVILIGLCQLVKFKFEVFESKVKEIFVSLLEGQMKLVVPQAISHGEEFVDDEKAVRVRRRKPPGQPVAEEDVAEYEGEDEEEDERPFERRLQTRKLPVVDMSWLQRPGMQEQMLEIQDMLNSMSAPSETGLCVSSSLEEGLSHSFMSEILTSSGLEPVEVDEGEGLSFFDCNILPAVPPLKLGGEEHAISLDHVQTPSKGEVTMREVILTERSALRPDTVRRRDSVLLEDIRPKKRTTQLRGINSKELERLTTWSDKVTTIDLESLPEPDFRKEWQPIAMECRAVTLVPALWVRLVEKLSRPVEERFEEIAHNELRRTILGLAREGSSASSAVLEEKLLVEEDEGLNPSFAFYPRFGQTPSVAQSDSVAANSNLPHEIETPGTIQTPAFPESNVPSSGLSFGTSSDVFGHSAAETPAPPFEEFLSSRKGWTATPIKQVDFDLPTTKLKNTVEAILNARKKQNADNPDKAPKCLFTELVPKTTCTKWQAAITLRHLLTLLAAGQFRARQLKSFGEIEIGFGPQSSGQSPSTRKRTAEDSENVCSVSNIAQEKQKRRRVELESS